MTTTTIDAMTDSAVVGPECHPGNCRGYGNPSEGVVFIGIAPGKDEVKTGRPLTGPSGRLLDNMLDAAGWSRDKVYATNMLCWYNNEPTPEQLEPCLPRLHREVADLRPKVVVLLGALVSETLVPGRKFGAMQGALIKYSGWDCWLIPTYHPAAILRGGGGDIATALLRDLHKIRYVLDNPPNPEVRYTVVASVADAQGVLDTLPRGPMVSLDVETDNPQVDDINVSYDRLRCLAVSTGPHTWVFPQHVLAGLRWPTDVNWTGHHFLFDTQVIRKHYGVWLPIKDDTLLMSYALDERTTGIHGLKSLSREYQGCGWYEEEGGRWWAKEGKEGDSAAEHAYVAHDAAYTVRNGEVFKPRMLDDGMERLYRDLLLPAANVFNHMQYRGVHINVERALELGLEFTRREQELDAVLTDEVVAHGGSPNINLASPVQLADLLFNTMGLPPVKRSKKTHRPSADRETLETLAEDIPFVDKLVELRQVRKMIGTYIMPLIAPGSRLVAEQRAHPTPLLHGTRTGRLAYTNPAVNTIPRPFSRSPHLAVMREMFDATPGYTLIEADYKQAEVWGAYLYCQDPTMLADLESGDFHSNTAQRIIGVDPNVVSKAVWTLARSDAKKSTFGMLYLIGGVKLGKQIGRSPEDAYKIMRDWHARYPLYQQNHVDARMREAREEGEIITPTGRKLRYPLVLDDSIINKVVNGPIQSVSHDILLSALIELHHSLAEYDAHILLDVHDALIFECPTPYVDDVLRIIKRVMEKPRFPGFPSVPMEAKVGTTWGKMTEVDV